MPDYADLLRQLHLWQRQLNMEISSSFRALDEQGLSASLFLLGAAFLYGALHAAGPGHGKAVVGSYFLAGGRKTLAAVRLGYMIAVVHTLSSLLFTLGIYFLLDAAFSRAFHDAVGVMYRVSGGLILLVGFYLLYEGWWKKEEGATGKREEGTKSALALAVSVGIAPCPGVMTVLLFSLVTGHLAVGIGASAAMSLGMGLTISLVAVLSVRLRKAGTGQLSLLLGFMERAAPLLVVSLGLFLLLGG